MCVGCDGGCRIPIRRVPGARFYNVHGHREKTVVIRLKDERYDVIVTEVNDPAAVVAQVNQAVEANQVAEALV